MSSKIKILPFSSKIPYPRVCVCVCVCVKECGCVGERMWSDAHIIGVAVTPFRCRRRHRCRCSEICSHWQSSPIAVVVTVAVIVVVGGKGAHIIAVNITLQHQNFRPMVGFNALIIVYGVKINDFDAYGFINI